MHIKDCAPKILNKPTCKEMKSYWWKQVSVLIKQIKNHNQMVKRKLYILFPSELLTEREPKTGAPTSCSHNFLKGRFYITHKISYKEKPWIASQARVWESRESKGKTE